jgi:hypothetical protein
MNRENNAIARTTARIRRTLAPTLKFIGDGYWIATLSSNVGACRGMSQDMNEALNRCAILFSGRKPIREKQYAY